MVTVATRRKGPQDQNATVNLQSTTVSNRPEHRLKKVQVEAVTECEIDQRLDER